MSHFPSVLKNGGEIISKGDDVKFHFIVLILFLALAQLSQCVSGEQGGHDNSVQKAEDLFGNKDVLVEAAHEEMNKVIEINQSNFKSKFPFMEVIFREKKEGKMDNEYEIDLPYDLTLWGSSRKVLISGDSLLMGPTLFYGYVIDLVNKEVIFKTEEKRKYYDMEISGDDLYVLNAPLKTIHRIPLSSGKKIETIKLQEKCREFIFWNDYLITDNYYSGEEEPALLIYKMNGPLFKCTGKRKQVTTVVNSARFFSSGDRLYVLWPFQNRVEIFDERFQQVDSFSVDTVNEIKFSFEDEIQHIGAFCIEGDELYYTVGEEINKKLILYKMNLKTRKTMLIQMAEDREHDITYMTSNNGKVYFVFDTGTRIIACGDMDNLKFQEVEER
ncbi:MAG: hypothetical protein JW894_00030 [Bacteroidales bacterium]|nr:hypothetical protein [Bacteroidales bacterium]